MIIDHQADQRFLRRVGMLRGHWAWILGAATLCAVAALVASLFLPKTYRVTTYILIS